MRCTTWLWARFLLLVDRLTGSRLVEWELGRRQRRIEQLLSAMDGVNLELDALKKELVLSQLAMCLAELRVRSEREDLEDWLCFLPDADGEELLLDAAIKHLVKADLAQIDARTVETGRYVYRLYPDWTAILYRLQNAPVKPDLIHWLQRQSQAG